MKKPTPLVQVNAFTADPFAGNPAAVCLLDDSRETTWLQQVAAQMNLSETAFVRPLDDGYELRWFTPKVEVELCGHATLASAHVLWEAGRLPHDQPARFHTRSGWLIANKLADAIELDFPAETPEPAPMPTDLPEALGTKLLGAWRNRLGYIVEVEDEATLRSLRPNFDQLLHVPMRSVAVTARSNSSSYDFISRFFAPSCGINEDPVTGSSHCGLTPFWAGRLGKTEMKAFQASARGGVIGVRLDGPRVYLAGQALTVWRGEWVA